MDTGLTQVDILKVKSIQKSIGTLQLESLHVDGYSPLGTDSIQGAVHGEVLEWLFTCYHELHNLGDEAANETFCIVIPMCAPVLKSLFLSKKQQVHTSMPSGNV
ncbi:hypothetical protein Y1Q_0007400 [Alligator mississippiensis]|uniref:Uncharacterized protein n=1 Tax=Alligator mississippiensis TaxID=8496 RepID=A0A151P7Q0_ALLMI|nr:hypothetical protein Y1Q_0007400 [Alligator mississippiensis]